MQECAVCNKAISPDRLSAQPRVVTCSASCVQEYRKRLNRRSSSAARRRKAVEVQTRSQGTPRGAGSRHYRPSTRRGTRQLPGAVGPGRT